MNALMTNVDPIRTEIMRLESAKYFDQRAWVNVLMKLRNEPCRRADAARRMETAKGNQKAPLVMDVDLTGDGAFMRLELIPVVAVETVRDLQRIVEPLELAVNDDH